METEPCILEAYMRNESVTGDKKWLFHLGKDIYKIKTCHEIGFYDTFQNEGKTSRLMLFVHFQQSCSHLVLNISHEMTAESNSVNIYLALRY